VEESTPEAAKKRSVSKATDRAQKGTPPSFFRVLDGNKFLNQKPQLLEITAIY
jgi:hypothetical protein